MVKDLPLLAVAVIWGSSYLAAKSLVVVGGVLAVLALRFLLTAFAMAPDGRIFVAEQPGRLRVIKNGSLLAAPAEGA